MAETRGMNGSSKIAQLFFGLSMEETLPLACSPAPNTLGTFKGRLWRKPAGSPKPGKELGSSVLGCPLSFYDDTLALSWN